MVQNLNISCHWLTITAIKCGKQSTVVAVKMTLWKSIKYNITKIGIKMALVY